MDDQNLLNNDDSYDPDFDTIEDVDDLVATSDDTLELDFIDEEDDGLDDFSDIEAIDEDEIDEDEIDELEE
jgi:hypothetical protein